MELSSFLDPVKTPGIAAAFVPRVDGIPGSLDKAATLALLKPVHREAVEGLGFSWSDLWRAEQVHGDRVAVVPDGSSACFVEGVDGLVTGSPGVLLGIYVADCGLIWLVDEASGALALLHSGKKGTEANILSRAVRLMREQFGTQPSDLTGVLGPCIRPPHYEVDFAKEIRAQAAGLGMNRFHDTGLCTGSDLERFYSYRLEKGKTGRMLGLLGRPG